MSEMRNHNPEPRFSPSLVMGGLIAVALTIAALLNSCGAPAEEEKPIGFTFANGDSKAEVTDLPTITPTTWAWTVGTTYTVTVPVDADTKGVVVGLANDLASVGVPAFAPDYSGTVAIATQGAQTVSVTLVNSTLLNSLNSTGPLSGSKLSPMVLTCTSLQCSGLADASFVYLTVNGVYTKINPNNASEFVITEITGPIILVP